MRIWLNFSKHMATLTSLNGPNLEIKKNNSLLLFFKCYLFSVDRGGIDEVMNRGGNDEVLF